MPFRCTANPPCNAGFEHFPYVNPDAPKGGRVEYAWPGTFDSINPFIVQGSGARGSIDLIFGNNVFETLMLRSSDEPFTLYPLLAKTVETDDQRSFAEFTLDERAKFSDGEPVTPEDVIFTLELLRDKGLPRYGVTASKIAGMEKVGEHGVRFTFKEPDRELPLILGLLPILPKHAIDAATFDKSTLKPMTGSGPYRLEQVRAGNSLTFKRNPDYWARDLPSKRGFDNYDEIRLTYYRDENAMFEAFKKGLVDVFIEENSGRWAGQYNFPAVANGDIVKETFKTRLPSGMFGIVMNTRRPVFQNVGVRSALIDLFDFEWANRSLFSGRLYAHQELLRQFRSVLVRPSGKRRGEGAACAVPRCGDAGDHERHVETAGFGRQRPGPGVSEDRLREAQGSGLRLEGRHDDRAGRHAARLRNHAEGQ